MIHDRRKLLGAALIALTLTAVTVIAIIGGGSGSSAQSEPSHVATPGSPSRFAYLAAQNTNRCDLSAGELRHMDGDRRLQGACCDPMDPTSYRKQVNELKRYAVIAQIPRDPYDVPVTLAQRLLRYRSAISLNRAESNTYERAMHISDLGGPCCCHCWRWQAFSGLARYLITKRDWQAPKLASLIDSLEGCGGRAEQPQNT